MSREDEWLDAVDLTRKHSWQRQAFAAGARSVRDEFTLAGTQNFLQVMLNDHVNNGGSGDDLCSLIIAALNSTKKLREVLKQRNNTQWPMT